MKNFTLKRIRLLPFLSCLFWLLMFADVSAQNINLTWDKESGCQVYKPRDKKDYNEDIGPGSCVRVCEQMQVIYSLNNSNSAWPAVWTVTGGTINASNNTSCTVTWGNSGFGFISVTVTTPNGPRTEEMCLEIIDGPKAAFIVYPGTAQSYEVCVDEVIYFTNMSSPDGGSQIVSYLWDFGDGTFSSEFEPDHAYASSGSYTVVLKVTNECNCTKSFKRTIKVDKAKAFPITCNSVVCEGGSDDYTIPKEIADKCTSFKWTVQGGTITSPLPHGPSINVTWDNVDASGFGYVTFDGTACGIKCAIVTIKVPVVKAKGTIVGDAVVCAYDQYRYKLPQWPTTDFVWSIDANGTGATIMNTDQRNEVIVNTGQQGDIILRCTYQNTMLKCGGVAEYKIHVKAMGSIVGQTEICQNTTETYTEASGYVATWTLKKPNNTTTTFTGTSFTNTFTVPGKYTLTITGNDFCPPSDPFIIRVDAIPAAPDVNDIVGPAKVCTASPVEYSMVNTVPGTVLVWQPINGTISGSNYGEAVTVEFTPGFGSYGIKVWRENTAEPHCISPIVTRVVTEHVVTLGITSDTANPVCASSTANYFSDYAEGEVYEWSVSPAHAGSVTSGNGTSSVSVLWNQIVVPNTFVKLRIRKCGVWKDASFAVTVMLGPTITITNVPASICPGVTFVPGITSSPPLTGGTITWNYGDGTQVTTNYNQVPLPYAYANIPSSTTYSVTVTIASPNGCLAPAIQSVPITVNPAPVALITPDTNRAFCNTVTPFVLTTTVQAGIGGTNSVQWYNGNTPISLATNFNYTVTAFGDYRAWVENSNGCGQFTNTVRVINSCGGGCTISPPPTVTMDATQGACNVIAASSVTTPLPVFYSWDAGLEATMLPGSTVNSAQFSFTKAGKYMVIYRATYNGTTGLCTVVKYDEQIIPYIPKVQYAISCSATPGKYDITVLDQSNYYPNTPLTSKIFYIDGTPYPVATSATSYTLTAVSPGSHTVAIELSAAGFLTCQDNNSVNLPAMPNSGITAPTTTCDGTGIQLMPAAGIDPNSHYTWNFGDGSSNLQPAPGKVYGSPGVKTITLTVSNGVGCATTSSVNITVAPNTLNGNLTSTSPNCEGDPIIITFNNTGSAVSTYTWMQDNNVIGAPSSPTLQVYDSGSYWLSVTNALGCIRPINAVPAKFIMTPDPVIQGPDGVCVNQSFKLSGYAGAGSLEYRWLIGSSPLTGWSSSAILNHMLFVSGTTTFKVEVRVPDGAGSYCVNSATYAVTAYDLPPTPTYSFNVVDCDPYTVKLHADTGVPGTYTWSNGMSGADITVNSGGPYLVTFTNPGGCTSTIQFDVPKDPEVYLWIFPKGCYEFCFKDPKDNGPFEILGPSPLVDFNKWIWYKNHVIDQGNPGIVPNYTISASGTYNLGLISGPCYKESDDMEVTITDCKCEVKMELKDVKVDNKPFCHYIVTLYIDNPSGTPMVVNINTNAGVGVFLPGAVTVPPGGGTFTFNFIPLTFTGGSIEIIATGTNKDGDLCRTIRKYVFPECRDNVATKSNMPEDDILGGLAKGNSLVIAPNPTSDVTGLTFTFASEKAQSRTIEIYSLMGVLLESYTPTEQTGKWTVNLGRYSAGQYIVVMREDGVALAQKAIIIE